MKAINKKRNILRIAAFSFSTAVLIASIPISAWFRQQREIARFQNIKAPDLLYLTAAHREQVKYLEIDTIDVKKYDTIDNEQHRRVYKDYVFCVAGEYVSSFTLQIAHTTNNPFIFEVYNAVPSLTNDEGGIEGRDYRYIINADYPSDDLANIDEHYITRGNDEESMLVAGDKVYYTTGTQIQGNYINRNIPTLNEGTRPYADYTVPADDNYEPKSYDDDDLIQINAEPAYWQKAGLQTVAANDGIASNAGAVSRKPFYREFILRVTWPDDERVLNNKETDIIYITVKS